MTLARCVAMVFLLSLLSPLPAHATWRSMFTPDSSGCDYYKNIERFSNCGAGGYPLAYGFSNCIAISGISGLTPEGVVWRERARTCLQRKLEAERTKSEKPMTCGALEQVAFETHPTCYLNPDDTASEDPSFCDLPPSDVAKIFHGIKKGDILTKHGLRATLKIAEYCAFHHALKQPKNEAEAEFLRQRQSFWERLQRD